MSLDTKYRPKIFKRVIGQEAAVKTMQGFVKKPPNAIFLHGPSGTGKTTLARVYALAVNCETQLGCGKCASCLTFKGGNHPDITEINAAEASGIDAMRSLIASAKYKPRFKRRIIIIDEAHQCSSAAMECLLKELEEPAINTTYILCTTEKQKFKLTTLNRCKKIAIEPVNDEALKSNLKRIAKLEDVAVSNADLDEIVVNSNGCVRESLALLESFIAGGSISALDMDTQNELKAVAKDVFKAIINRDPILLAKSVLSMPKGSAVSLLNQVLWYNEFAMTQLCGLRSTPYTFYSPDNLQAFKQLKGVKMEQLLAVQASIYTCRKQLFDSTLKEHSVMLALL